MRIRVSVMGGARFDRGGAIHIPLAKGHAVVKPGLYGGWEVVTIYRR